MVKSTESGRAEQKHKRGRRSHIKHKRTGEEKGGFRSKVRGKRLEITRYHSKISQEDPT